MSSISPQPTPKLEVPTSLNLPSDPLDKNNLLQTRADDNQNRTSFSSCNQQLSLTQKQIMSHSIICQVIEESKKKTVQHYVNCIPINTKLYRVPQQPIQGQFDFSIIPPSNKDYVSTTSQKVNEIHVRLSDKKNLSQRLINLSELDNKYSSKSDKQRPKSVHNVNKRVSVSGLVTYNFNSVKARVSLGSLPTQPEEMELERRISESKKRSYLSMERQMKIIKRKANIYNIQKIEIGKAAVCDFHTQTDKFLRALKRQSEKDEKIYGQRMQRLNCIKQYMQKQKTEYQQAQFIVQAIMNSKYKNKVVDRKLKKQYPIPNEDELLSKRRQVFNRKKVMLRNLYFTE